MTGVKRGPGRLAVPLALLVLAGCGDGSIPSQEERQGLAEHARGIGVAADLIYVVDLPGHEPAPQSVGVYGAEGFSTAYVSPDGMAMLTVDRGSLDEFSCAQLPVTGADRLGEPVECHFDGEGWHRVSGEQHEYAVVRDNHVIALAASLDSVDPESLKSAAVDAHQPDSDELDALFPDGSVPEWTPVQRGDLPPDGDGAPHNADGTGQEG